MSENRPRLLVLDGVRGLAILLVMLHHFTVIHPRFALEHWLVNISELGRYGVDLFFVLSGFLITGILLGSKGKASYFKNFYVRRALRIFPLYYGVVFFSFFILPTLLQHNSLGAHKLVRFNTVAEQWPAYVLFCSNFLIAIKQSFSHGVLDVTWSLSIEEQFYLVWPAIVYLLEVKQLKKIILSIIFFALISRIILFWLNFSWIQIYVLTFTRMDAIAFGCLLAINLKREEKNSGEWIWFVIIGAILVGAFMAGFFELSSFGLNFVYSGVAMLFYSLIKMVLTAPENHFLQRVFLSRFLRVFGRYSFAIYLFHLPIRAAIRDLFFGDEQFRSLGGEAFVWQILFYILSAAVSLACAWISWHVLEKHFLKYKKFFSA